MSIHDILAEEMPAIGELLIHVNHGGCGQFAHQLSMALSKQGIPSDIVLVKWSWYTEEDITMMCDRHHTKDINEVYIERFTDGYKGYFDACLGHVAVRVGDKLYDSGGEFTGKAISAPVRPEVMALLLTGDRQPWNPTFLQSNNMLREEVSDMLATFFSSIFSDLPASEVVA